MTANALLDPTIWTGKIFTGSWVETGKTTQTTEPATGESSRHSAGVATRVAAVALAR